jgi:hypothetical protein
VIWDERLITRERAANLCGTWPLTVDHPLREDGTNSPNAHLRCGTCDGHITRLPSDGMLLSVDVLIAAVVRHMAMSHDYNLSGVSNEGKGTDAAAAGGAGNGSSRDIACHLGH